MVTRALLSLTHNDPQNHLWLLGSVVAPPGPTNTLCAFASKVMYDILKNNSDNVMRHPYH